METGYKGEVIDLDNHAHYDQVFGGPTTARTESKDHSPYLPDSERQGAFPFCVTESRLHAAETIGREEGTNLKLSVRELGVVSGTTRAGNSLQQVSETFRVQGVSEDKFCEFPFDLLAKGLNAWDELFTLPADLPTHPKFKGGNHSWVSGGLQTMIDALDYSPLQIGFQVSSTYNNVVITPPKKGDAGIYHAVELFYIGPDGYHIFDSISNALKTLPLEYPIIYVKSFRDLPNDWKALQAKANSTGHQFNVNLAYGQSSPEVHLLQEALSKLKIFTAIPTGYFGPVTAKAVLDFRQTYGISSASDVLGHSVGPITRAALNKLNIL